jgi:ribosomal protein S18 acetylase RimI-like enzyme
MDSPQAPVAPATRTRSATRWRRWVPIRRLGERHRARLLGHLLSLDERDRYLRFGHAASDATLQRYVRALDFSRDEVFGIFNRRLALVATSHLAYVPEDEASGLGRMAEFAVSVLPVARGRGHGDRLFAHATRHLRNQAMDRMFIHALSENTTMLHIARKAGATVTRSGGDAEAWLQLPRHSLGSRLQEWLDAHAAELSYGLRRQARAWAGLWRRRLGVR